MNSAWLAVLLAVPVIAPIWHDAQLRLEHWDYQRHAED